MQSMNAILTLSHTIPPAAIIFVAAWLLIKRAGLSGFGRTILTSAAFVISMSTAIDASFWIFGNLRPIFIFPVCAVLVGVLILDIRRKPSADHVAQRSRTVSIALIATLMLGVVVLGAGRQFEYKSAWGDIGAYLTAAQHYSRGGSVTFAYASRGHLLSEPGKPLPLTGVVNDTPNGLQQFHALPGWPGWMALFGSDRHRAGILPLLFAFSIGAFYLLATRWYTASLAALIPALGLAILPVAWFQSLYPTSEMLALSTVLATLVLLAHSRSGLASVAIGIFAFGTTHISLIVVMPLITAAMVVAGTVPTKEKWWAAWAGIMAAAAGVSAVWFAFHVSNFYSSNISHSLFGNRSWLMVVIAACPIAASFWEVLSRKVKRLRSSAQALLSLSVRYAWVLGLLVILLVLGSALTHAYLLGWTEHYLPQATSIYNSDSARVAYVDKGFRSLEHLSIVNLLAASGIIGLLAFFALPFHWRKVADERSLALWMACAYIVIIYGVAQVDTTNNYYASRYFLPFAVPLLLLLSVPWLSRLGKSALVSLLAIPVAAYYVAAMLFHGFFAGDARFARRVDAMIGNAQTVYVSGSRWLTYFIAPSLMSPGASSEGSSNTVRRPQEPNSMVLVTDDENIMSGEAECVTSLERPIPWQIGYLTNPELDRKSICVVRRVSGPVTISLGSNHWLVGGKMTFTIQAPANSPSLTVAIESDGWWSMKKPFVDHSSLDPQLKVCGRPFKLDQITPKRIIFSGTMASSFCEAQLQTATFVPSETGEGNDARELGVDLHEIIIGRKWKP